MMFGEKTGVRESTQAEREGKDIQKVAVQFFLFSTYFNHVFVCFAHFYAFLHICVFFYKFLCYFLGSKLCLYDSLGIFISGMVVGGNSGG